MMHRILLHEKTAKNWFCFLLVVVSEGMIEWVVEGGSRMWNNCCSDMLIRMRKDVDEIVRSYRDSRECWREKRDILETGRQCSEELKFTLWQHKTELQIVFFDSFFHFQFFFSWIHFWISSVIVKVRRYFENLKIPTEFPTKT